jgi:ERF superfamily
MSALPQALLAAQKDVPAVQKTSINPHFKNKFVSLDSLLGEVLPVLNKHGLVLLQLPTTVDGHPALRTRIVHAESGEAVEDTMLLMAAKDDPQGQGAAITYARRYSLMSMLGLIADEDDDGNRAARRSAAGQPDSQETANRATPAASTFTAPALRGGDEELRVHFGKNGPKDGQPGKALGSLTSKSLAWYANDWEIDPSRASLEDYTLKEAAQRLWHGEPVPVASGASDDDGIPF